MNTPPEEISSPGLAGAEGYPAQPPRTPPGLLSKNKNLPPSLFPQPGLWERTKGVTEFPSKATGHMVKRSGPLGSCFHEVMRPPRQCGSSLGWGWPEGVCSGAGLLICQMPNSRRLAKQPPSGPCLCIRAGGRGECRNPCLCPRSGPQTSCDHLLSS